MSFEKNLRTPRGLMASVAVACLLSTHSAGATLGEDVASVVGNHTRLGGATRVTAIAHGERHELILPSGLVIHQYVAAGAVYAIAWSGPRPPNLQELLGTYFPKLTRTNGGAGSHHRLSLRADDFRVEAMAHRGSFVGRAWVPSLVPVGVDVAVLP